MKLKQRFISIHGPKHYSGKHFQEGSIKNNIENLKLKMFSLHYNHFHQWKSETIFSKSYWPQLTSTKVIFYGNWKKFFKDKKEKWS